MISLKYPLCLRCMMSNVMSETLYDKIIDVELQRVLPESQIKTVVSIMGDDVSTQGSIGTVKSTGGIPIAIYTGFSHKEYKTSAGGKKKEVTVTAEGITLGVQVEDTEMNWWNDTSFIRLLDSALAKAEKDKQAVIDPTKIITKYTPGGDTYTRTDTSRGCRITVTRNGKQEQYHAVYLQEDAESTSTYHIEKTTKISCTKGSMKPSISFTTSVIPGNSCYKLILKITNLNLDYDIRSVKRVRVTAGYRTQGFQEIFDCPVFSSYIESPNPDGITVFECLCVGRVSSYMENRPINFHYLGGKVTIRQFIDAIGKGLGVTVYNYLLNSSTKLGQTVTGYNDLEIKISGTNLAGKKTYAENAAAVLTWARQIIQKRIAAAEGFTGKSQVGSKVSYPYIQMHLTSDGLYVYALNKPNSDSLKAIQTTLPKDVVILDAVKGASFNGVALTVRALWNPKVRPGCLFKMQPNIYNGANLPNSLTREAFGDDAKNNYYYRCVTCSISFSTNGDENEMSLLAIPIVYMEDSNPLEENALQSWEGFIALSQSTFDVTGARDISFGEPDSKRPENTEAKKNRQVVTTNTNNMFDMDILDYFPSTIDYTIQTGDTLSVLAQQFFRQGNGWCDFDIQPEKIADLPQGVWKGELDDRAFLWPLIAVVTYRKYIRLKAAKISNSGYETMEKMKNPNMIRVGRKLVIPTISNFSVLQKCREIFKYAYQAWYSNFPTYGNWARDWVTAYQYLGGSV